MNILKLKKELDNLVMASIAEWESENQLKAHYRFEIYALELISEDITRERNKGIK